MKQMTTQFVDKQLEEEVDHILMNAFSSMRKKLLHLFSTRERRLVKSLQNTSSYTDSRKMRKEKNEDETKKKRKKRKESPELLDSRDD